MKRIPVRSTSVQAVGYDAEKQVLEIAFRNRRVYRYRGVSAAVHEGLLASPQKALFIEQVIEKGGYAKEQVR